MARYRVGLETRARIIEATREVLGEHGLDSATLKAITDRAGVGAGSFYNLFKTKEEVVLEVLREAIVAVDPDPSEMGRETLDDLLDAFVNFVTGDTGTLARIHLQLAGSALSDPVLARRMQRSHRRRVQRFSAAISRAEPSLEEERAEVHAETLLAALTGLAMRWLYDEDFDFPGHVTLLPRVPSPVPAPG